MPEIEERQARIEGILDQLGIRVGRIEVQLDELRSELANIRDEIRNESAGIRDEFGKELAGIRDELRKELTGVKDELRKELTGVRDESKRELADIRSELLDVRKEVSTNFRWSVGMWITIMLAIIGLYFKG